MSNAFYQVPKAVNETVLGYGKHSPERVQLKQALKDAKSKELDIPMVINGKKIYTENKIEIRPPHERNHLLAKYNKGDATHVKMAIEAALQAKHQWASTPWEQRAAIFLKAAELLATKYRMKLNAATMLGQSKNAYQAEIDSACELIDFWRYNVQFMQEIYAQQPESARGMWNRTEWRPLEGFVFALTPFNFTAIAGNLPTAPAMMGNTVVWKASETQIYSANIIMEILHEAGLPNGVINLIFVSGAVAGDVIFSHKEFAGLHFTGGTETFNHIWRTIGNNLEKYRSYPRIVGETGGKDYVIAHHSANAKEVAVALSRGAFEYQGQKCSAASRAYIPSTIWDDVKRFLEEDINSMKIGTTENFENFINAVIDEKSFDTISSYIERAKKSSEATVIIGGKYDKTEGYFIQPTVIRTTNPTYETMTTELFGPVLTIFVYDENKYEETLQLVDETSGYALTGSIFARERYAIDVAFKKLQQSAGNFYINDKPTGAVVGQQPFGGARLSGTNDKAGSMLNLLRWTSARTVKETFVPPVDYRYPFLEDDMI